MRKMTLEHHLLNINRNKMNIWTCMVLRPNAQKSSHFHIQNAIKTTCLKRTTWNLLHTFFRGYSSTYFPFFFLLKIWKFGGIFCKHKKMLKKSSNIQIIKKFKNRRWQFCSRFFSVYTNLFRLSLCLKMSVWQRFSQTLIFDLKWQNMTSLWRHSRPNFHGCEIFLWSTCVEVTQEGFWKFRSSIPLCFWAMLGNGQGGVSAPQQGAG